MFCSNCGSQLPDGTSFCSDCGTSVKAVPDTPSGSGMDTRDEKMWATICHLAGLAYYFGGFGGIIATVVVWLLKRNDSPVIDAHGKAAVNFQITMIILSMISFILAFVGIGIILLFALIILNLVFVIIAAIKANNGELYRYPLSLKLIR